MTKVFVGMSGGVDSSLTAALLVEQGYDVTGVYMKNWTQDMPGMRCPWADDLADAKRVAVQLGIDFRVFDFEKEYKQNVVNYMIDEYKLGHTPNPDVMCNQEVKFKLFLDVARAQGADFIATGHYARVEDSRLLRAEDDNKDQTYFLYRVTSDALAMTMFPLGDYKKSQVREEAEKRGLFTAKKKDSQGICFVGQVGIRDFLRQYVTPQAGNIIDKQSGEVLGRHDGAIFYTIGQRHGLDIGGGLPYYVVGKNMDSGDVFVTTNLNDDSFWRRELRMTNVHWINLPLADGASCEVRVRHRGALIPATFISRNGETSIVLSEPERAVTPGQSVVIYSGNECVGGGIVTEALG